MNTQPLETSSVASLRRQIEQEHKAMVWGLTGLSQGGTQHAFITRRMGHLDRSYQGLSALIGEEEATAFICAVFEQSPSQR